MIASATDAPVAAAFALLGCVAVAAMCLAAWCCWLLHRHWPQSDAATAKEIAAMLWTAEQQGRKAAEEAVNIAGDLDASAERDRAKTNAQKWRQEIDQRQPLEDRPKTVVTLGSNPVDPEES